MRGAARYHLGPEISIMSLPLTPSLGIGKGGPGSPSFNAALMLLIDATEMLHSVGFPSGNVRENCRGTEG